MSKENKLIRGQLSISRRDGGGVPARVTIKIRDEVSRTDFVEIEIPFDEFARALMGSAERPMGYRTKGLDVIGKERINENRKMIVDNVGYDKDVYSKIIDRDFKEEGWKACSYLGSKNSITRLGDEKVQLSFVVSKYEESKDNEYKHPPEP
ncbi:hypothetical protein KASHIRA_01680 [Serratia phage vB_SmaM-Kashira]|nr:hypothetical protein [Acinetobacter phage ABPH49]URC22742.1 hypothetical protein KASHIRA_01680 [Serratia phage vB_SmaM-Kashira]